MAYDYIIVGGDADPLLMVLLLEAGGSDRGPLFSMPAGFDQGRCELGLEHSAVLGLVWYFVGYRSAVEKRLPGFFIQSMACFLLFIGAAAGVVMRFGGS